MKPHPRRDGGSPQASVDRIPQPDPDLDPDLDLVGRGMALWRRERPDIDSSGKAIVGRILRLRDLILKAVDASLAPHGLKYPAYAVLTTLRVSGRPYRMSPRRLQATMLFTSGGLSNLLRRLERRKLIRRMADPGDRRGVLVELTPQGFAIVERAMVDHATMERRLIRMFSGPERESLAVLLSRMLTLDSQVPTGL